MTSSINSPSLNCAHCGSADVVPRTTAEAKKGWGLCADCWEKERLLTEESIARAGQRLRELGG